MGNKGQVLVFFVISIPLLLLIGALVIDVGVAYGKYSKINSINKMAIRYGLENIDKDNIKEEIIKLLYENDKDIEQYNLLITNQEVELEIHTSVDSILGKIIGIKSYKIESNYWGYLADEKIIIEKGYKNG